MNLYHLIARLLSRNGGVLNTAVDGHAYVLVRRDDFEAIERVWKSGQLVADGCRYVVLRTREQNPHELYPFGNYVDAATFYDKVAVGWSDTYLTEVLHGPGNPARLAHSDDLRCDPPSHVRLHGLQAPCQCGMLPGLAHDGSAVG